MRDSIASRLVIAALAGGLGFGIGLSRGDVSAPDAGLDYRITQLGERVELVPVDGGRTAFIARDSVSERAREGDVLRPCNRPVPTQGRTVTRCIDHSRRP